MNSHCLPALRQRGAILIITLVIMAAMTLASVGVMRSVDTSILLSGNLGFKRDLTMRANVATQQVLTKLRSTAFLAASDTYCYTATNCATNAENYSPIMLETAADGVPVILQPVNTSRFVGTFTGTLSPTQVASMGLAKVSVYYLIERLCDVPGSPLEDHCTYDDGPTQLRNNLGDYRGGANELLGGGKAGTTAMPLFRLTVRADGPRNSVAYVQTISAIQ